MVISSKKKLDTSKLKSLVIPVLKRHQVSRAGIFGSVAIGTADNTSDPDLLVELCEGKTLLDFVSLKLELEEETHIKVDLLTYKSINPLIRDNVLKQEVRIIG